MTPEELWEYWKAIRDDLDDEIIKLWDEEPQKAQNKANQLAALHFAVHEGLKTFKAQT